MRLTLTICLLVPWLSVQDATASVATAYAGPVRGPGMRQTGLSQDVRGQVLFNGLPVPGAVVTAVQGSAKVIVISDAQGNYSLVHPAPGPWSLTAAMPGFETREQTLFVPSDPLAAKPDLKIEMKMLSVSQMLALSAKLPEPEAHPIASAPTPEASKENAAKAPAEAPRSKPLGDSDANDGFLINGSSQNAATSKYSLAPAFGNTRSSRSLYNGGLGLRLGDSAFDARPDSITGLETPKASYSQATVSLTFGGPIRIPRVLPHGPDFFIPTNGHAMPTLQHSPVGCRMRRSVWGTLLERRTHSAGRLQWSILPRADLTREVQSRSVLRRRPCWPCIRFPILQETRSITTRFLC